MVEVSSLLVSVNGRHGTAWALVGKLPGGYLQGAYELRGATGQRAVLKWHLRHLPAERLAATARAIEYARSRGWPTPAWLTYGAFPDHGAYIVEQFIEGRSPTSLEPTMLEQLLEANRLQADIRPETPQDWSGYIHRVVFENGDGLAARMRGRPETAALLRRLEHLTSGFRGLRLPTADLVHGDFVLNNMIVRDDRVYLVDAAQAGKGTRAYDLATLLMETTVGGDYTTPALSDRRRLEQECVAIVGRPGLLICIACRMILLLVFGGDHWGDHIPPMVAGCETFLDGLEPV